ncbi:hypothetical protein [Flavihumibacter fluvii]|uniref:hypothetical protein n=1 Tax=Flavihumibacter fluvii TaxID=2838157 RepID=UPI001BDF150E|nr:hypothetical protein [Flavihumibacter fluvii]ULQ54618.1 hypothetical protein KJS93_09835 [Flavihumibacter fluvii]
MFLKFDMAIPLAVMIIVLGSSCNKPDIISPEPNPGPSVLVKRITASEIDFMAFEYNAQKNVTKYISQWKNSSNGGVTRIVGNYLYLNNRLMAWSNPAGRAEFAYFGDKIAITKNFYLNGTKMADNEYTYDANDRITQVIENIASPVEEGAQRTKITYAYYPDGNLQKMAIYYQLFGQDKYKLSYTRTYLSYDDRVNPEPSMIITHHLPGVRLYRNNPTLIKDNSPGDSREILWRMNYTYNDAGYPIQKVQQIETNGQPQPSITFNYTY